MRRRSRDGDLSSAGYRAARRVLSALDESWIELQPSEMIRTAAERLLAAYSLRAADAFQFGAALAWCGGRTARHTLVTLDARLREVATREGFDAIPDED